MKESTENRVAIDDILIRVDFINIVPKDRLAAANKYLLNFLKTKMFEILQDGRDAYLQVSLYSVLPVLHLLGCSSEIPILRLCFINQRRQGEKYCVAYCFILKFIIAGILKDETLHFGLHLRSPLLLPSWDLGSLSN